MSKFNSYAKRLNEAAKEAFETYQKAEQVYKGAEDRRKRLPWNATAEEKTLAEARIIEARQGMDKAKTALYAGLDTMRGIRTELAKDLVSAYQANPEDIDPNTMELLKAGILTPAEYVNLANKAIKSGNITMLRVIGSYADKLEKDSLSMEDRGALYAVVSKAKTSTGAEELGRYDSLVDVYERCTRNPNIIDHWDELTQAEIADF